MFAVEPTPDILDAFPASDRAAEQWRAQARCATGTGALVDLFFSENIDDINRAKAFCLGCEVRTECLDAALERHEPWGVWGGELFLHGKVLAHKRKRGRPPKVRPPEPQLPSDPFEGLLPTAGAPRSEAASA